MAKTIRRNKNGREETCRKEGRCEEAGREEAGREETGREKASREKSRRQEAGRKETGSEKSRRKETGCEKTGRKETGCEKTGREKGPRKEVVLQQARILVEKSNAAQVAPKHLRTILCGVPFVPVSLVFVALITLKKVLL